ncbi:MAG TPA: cytochrome c family protein [Parvularcula sp.]|nr:cytochrome c family protein [Parvularcula sp.]HBS31310.1 cytochrome c family protein [Parvularcula sp.]HBS34371.1 cytochrome c family protein [Parvularcula sp.]
MNCRFSTEIATIGLMAMALALAGCGGKSEPSPAPAAVPAKIEAEPEPAAQPNAEPAPAPEAAPDTAVADAAAPGDPVKGKRVFLKCLACHSIAMGENKVGPSLYKIVGAAAGKSENFRYSDALAASGVIWTEEALDAYLENPAKNLPGNKMLFPGLPTPQERADVIAYLKSVE